MKLSKFNFFCSDSGSPAQCWFNLYFPSFPKPFPSKIYFFAPITLNLINSFSISHAPNSLPSSFICKDDNSSNDNNKNNQQIINDFNDNRIKYIHLTKNKKQCHARNIGLTLCTGNWVRYLDDDDYLLDNCLCEYYNAIIENSTIKVFTTKYLCGNDIEGCNFSLLNNIFEF